MSLPKSKSLPTSETNPSQEPSALSWKVSGMDCASCAAKIRGAVERLPGVSDVKLSVMTETLTLALDEHQTKPTEIEKRVSGLGYTVQRVAKPVQEESSRAASCGCGHDHGHKHGDHDRAGHDHAGHGHEKRDHGTPLQSSPPKADSGHGLPGHVHEVTPDGVSWYQTGKGRLVLGTGALLAAAWGIGLDCPRDCQMGVHRRLPDRRGACAAGFRRLAGGYAVHDRDADDHCSRWSPCDRRCGRSSTRCFSLRRRGSA